ncbi:hypothetical protein TorRG33x02_068300 [Trema orientale]|uniref:Reverse transcriptase domain-containing protein n=1 Tax=Trema orientale TaxID=63057 RepID=A0A2P5FHW4_TREOI|nr:hypothetical protein TorRG33x02_068300 [Trema orientale]
MTGLNSRFSDESCKLMAFVSSSIDLINFCISSVTFSILLNGSPLQSFQPNCSLHQGDPMSPYLFILCNEVLSKLLLKEESLVPKAKYCPIGLFWENDYNSSFVKKSISKTRDVVCRGTCYLVGGGDQLSRILLGFLGLKAINRKLPSGHFTQAIVKSYELLISLYRTLGSGQAEARALVFVFTIDSPYFVSNQKPTSDFHDPDSNKGTRAMTSFIDKGLVFYWGTTETSDTALDLMASTKSSDSNKPCWAIITFLILEASGFLRNKLSALFQDDQSLEQETEPWI